MTGRSASRPVELPLALERLEQPARGRRSGDASSGGVDLDVVEADDRIERRSPDVEALAHDLAVDLALRRDVDERVAAGPCAVQERRRSAARPVLGPVGRLDSPNGERWSAATT